MLFLFTVKTLILLHAMESFSSLPKLLFFLFLLNITFTWHCVESVHIRSFSSPYFSRDLQSNSPYSVRIWKNANQKNSQYGHFLRSVILQFTSKAIIFSTFDCFNPLMHVSKWSDTFLTFPASCFSKSCIKIKINLNFYFHTSLWCRKRFHEGLKGLQKTFYGTTKMCENKNWS